MDDDKETSDLNKDVADIKLFIESVLRLLVMFAGFALGNHAYQHYDLFTAVGVGVIVIGLGIIFIPRKISRCRPATIPACANSEDLAVLIFSLLGSGEMFSL